MTDMVIDIFEKALREAGMMLKDNEEAIELPDGTVLIVEIVPDSSPTVVTCRG